jgi:SAM-dependent methyltransferase
MTDSSTGKPTRDDHTKLGVQDLQSYWETLHQQSRRGALPPLAAVCIPGVPELVNRLSHREHARLLARLWSRVPNLQGLRVLDIGCGVGRWLEVLRASGGDVVGIDWSLAALTGVRERLRVPVLRMSVTALGFADETFDGINCVTVLQHNPPDTQELALRETFRILKPGGWFSLLESTPGGSTAPHMFPRSENEWMGLAKSSGFEVVRVERTSFGSLLTDYIRLRHWIGARAGRASSPRAPVSSARQHHPWLVRLNAAVLLGVALMCFVLSRLLGWVPGLKPSACAILLRRPH